jgi:rod shape-determining protein MreD
MKLNLTPKYQISKNVRIFLYFLIALVFITIHLTFLDVIQISEILPDLLIILITWVTIREGRFFALFFAFVVGLGLDAASYDVLGSNALAKLVSCFVIGFFYQEEKELFILKSFRFLIILFIGAVISNLIYHLLYINFTELTVQRFIAKNVLANSFYTTVIGIIPLFYNLPRKNDYKF